YEVHVQDFTDLLPVPDNIRGTMPAMIKPGLRNERRARVGFDYLVDLGINVVHLMPVQEFLHYPDDEWQAAFRDDPYMIEQGVNLENYQWGYRTTHAFAVETRFRSRDSDFGAQREQFRDLVDAFHEKGIAVIIDIVPNHTGENMDGRNYYFNFNAIDKPYYYRTDEDLNHIGPFGNEVKTEDRPMVQRWIIDQCRHFVEEFGIDGFRIDLAGQIDEQTLRRLKEELPEDLIIYGEPWIAISDPEVAANPDWAWYKEDAPITYFQDDARNAFKGTPDNPRDKTTDRGYAGGNTSLRDQVMLALTNGFPEEIDPKRGINYLDIHDNWALADRFAVRDWDGRQGVHEVRYKIAATLLLTSLGPVVLHGGSEMMRSKGLAPLQEIVKRTSSGELHFHGKRDTYNLRKANDFVWDNVGAKKGDAGINNDYQNMIEFWKGLIALRNSDAGKAFRLVNPPPEDHYRWIAPQNAASLGYVVDDSILVLINVGEEPFTFEVDGLGGSTWLQIADNDAVDHAAGVPESELHTSSAGQSSEFTVEGPGLQIWLLSQE
ncbi:MAG: pullulanase, partial [Rhodothermia bacterium]|nr:pullulanase [Rhodothermia bacterium]